MSGKSTKHSYVSKTNWKKLWQEDDNDISYDDSPATDAAFWTSAQVIMPAVRKIPLSIRLDPDIVQYFKDLGKGYQSKMNAVLRSYMISHQTKKA